MMKALLYYIARKDLGWLCLAITAQQLLTAAGTYALANAGLSIHEPKAFAVWVLSSILAFLLTPAFSILIRNQEVRIGFAAYRIYLDDNLFHKSGQSLLWMGKTEKNRFLTSLNSDAHDFLSFMLLLMTDLYSFSLSIVLGVIVLSAVIDVSLLPAFILSGSLSGLIYLKMTKNVDTLYNLEQAAKLELGGHLLRSWDHVLLNNKGLNNSYQERTKEKIDRALQRSVETATTSESLVFALGVAAGMPVLISVFWILSRGTIGGDTATLTALLATLPRQLQYLGVFRSLFLTLTSLLGVNAKLRVLIAGTKLRAHDAVSHIKTESMTMNQIPLTTVEDLLRQIKKTARGRFEIRGPNGVGKSSLLLLLNTTLPSSFYLPANPEFDLEINSHTLSTGERLLAHIQYIKTISEDYILLDEWDANLDVENLETLSLEIDQLSQTKTIIEVRHRDTHGKRHQNISGRV